MTHRVSGHISTSDGSSVALRLQTSGTTISGDIGALGAITVGNSIIAMSAT